jgi:hypothetical protein
MGRKRTRDKWLPPRVYKGKAAYEFHPVGGGAVRLCGLDAAPALVHRKYAEALDRLETQAGTFKDLALQYQDSEKFKTLAPSTQKDYLKHHKKVEAVFGHMHVDNIQPKHIRAYMDRRSSKKQANLEKAYMSAVYKWGFQRGKASRNPCTGVEAYRMQPRDRYITDAEYLAVYKHASTPVRIAMEIAYLCAARKGDILKMTRAQLVPEGLYIQQSKTGTKQIKRLSPRLADALKPQGKVRSIYLVHKADGSKYTISGFDSAWQKAVKAAGMDKAGFTFHDIKAKGVSDYEGDKQKFSGHKTPAQVATYDRKIEIVDALDAPAIKDDD